MDDGSACSAIALYDGDESLFIAFNAKTKTTYLEFSNKNAKSLQENERRKLYIVLRSPSGKFDHDWGEKEFKVGVFDDGKRSFLTVLVEVMIDDIAKNDRIGFFYGEKSVGVFNLDGTVRMISKLRDCSRRLAGINPLDPFAN